MPRKRILIVEDEDNIAELEALVLRRADFDYTRVPSAEEAIIAMENQSFDLILLDIMLPKMSGIDFAKLLKSRPHTAGIPIIMTTAKNEEGDIIAGLDSGASDYITKPFSPKILVARVNARLRDGSSAESSSPEINVIEKFGVKFTCDSRTVEIANEKISLTANECAILRILMLSADKPVARDAIVAKLYRTGYAINGRAIDVQIVNLRRKFADKSILIKTIRGIGYSFSNE